MARFTTVQELFHPLAATTNDSNKQSIKFLLNSPTPLVHEFASSSVRSDSETSSIDDIISAAHFLAHVASTVTQTKSNSDELTFSSISDASTIPPRPSHQSRGVQKRRRKRASVSCDICGREFAQPGAMRKHKRVVHDKVKDFECGVCQRPFAEKSNLKKHIQAKHQQERVHKCKECNKMFNFTDGLRRHINNCHLGLRPYKCDICDSTFKQRTHMQKHRENIHNDVLHYLPN